MDNFDAMINRMGSTITLQDGSTVKAIVSTSSPILEGYGTQEGFHQPLREPILMDFPTTADGALIPGQRLTFSGEEYRFTISPPPLKQADRLLAARRVAARTLSALDFPNLCDLWEPTVGKVGKELAGATYTLYAHNQRCLFVSTPEVDVPEAQGRSKQVNIFTLDVFNLPAGVPVRDGWIIKLLDAGDNANLFWSVQGNPQAMLPRPYWPPTVQLVYAKRLPLPPAGVS